MAVNPAQLADEITVAMGFSLPASTEIQAFALGLMNGLTSGSVAIGGNIVGINGSSISAAIQAGAGYPSITPELDGFGTSFATYVMANGTVTPSPPALPSGPILGLSGAGYATALAAASGFPSITSELLGFATAVMDHITNNAVVIVGVIT